MHVVATAGHVDHGKSTLVRALTGTDPDRLAEEQRRGMTIDLGYAWTRLDTGLDDDVAFVDVPGHERFVPTALAGLGPVPVVLLVVAADGGWMPQTSEHRDALAALGVRHGLLVLTRTDLADDDQRAATLAQAREELAGTPLAGAGEVEVSARTGAGLPALRQALASLLAGLPAPDPAAPVRLWVDRSFSVRGAGTVVTGTLPAGTVTAGDVLATADGTEVGVRGVQTLGRPAPSASGTARVALNLRGVSAAAVHRGDALVTPGSATSTAVVDVVLRALSSPHPSRWPQDTVLHLGSAAVSARLRPLRDGNTSDNSTDLLFRLTLREHLPLRIGDVGLLRDPGARRVLAGVVVLDPAPEPLRRRGAARVRAAELAAAVDALAGGRPDAAGELHRRRIATCRQLVALGVAPADVEALAASEGVLRAGDHLLDPAAASSLRIALGDMVVQHVGEHPLEPGPTTDAARHRLGLPAGTLLEAVAALPAAPGPGPAPDAGSGLPLAARDGRIVPAAAVLTSLPPAVAAAVTEVLADLRASPFAAPEAHRLRDLGLGPRELAAAVRTGALVKVADGVYLAPGALEQAVAALGGLPQPFTAADARRVWATTRRIAVPLLELIDRRGATRRLPDSSRVLTAVPSA